MFAIFVSFVLFWVSRMVSGFLESYHTRANRRNRELEADRRETDRRGVERRNPVYNLHETTDALRDIFLTLSVVALAWEIVNGIGAVFEIITWIVLAWSLLWAIGKGTKCRFVDIWLLGSIALFVVLWIPILDL